MVYNKLNRCFYKIAVRFSQIIFAFGNGCLSVSDKGLSLGVPVHGKSKNP